jgi:hypothetical protein
MEAIKVIEAIEAMEAIKAIELIEIIKALEEKNQFEAYSGCFCCEVPHTRRDNPQATEGEWSLPATEPASNEKGRSKQRD